MNETPSKQAKLSIQQNQKLLTTSKYEMNMLVASYIVYEMLFLSIVESPSFQKILGKVPIAGDDEPPSNA